MTFKALTPKQRLTGIFGGTALLLVIPLIAMQFTSEVQWNLVDFLLAGVLLLGAGLAIEGITRIFSTLKSRILFISVILMILMVVWIELAVGLFGTPWAGN